jgi:hypothetical protein
MMDFSANELTARAIMSQRDRDAAAAYRLAEFRQPPRGLRATLATRLAHIAVHLDGETTDRLVGRHLKTARRHW